MNKLNLLSLAAVLVISISSMHLSPALADQTFFLSQNGDVGTFTPYELGTYWWEISGGGLDDVQVHYESYFPADGPRDPHYFKVNSLAGWDISVQRSYDLIYEDNFGFGKVYQWRTHIDGIWASYYDWWSNRHRGVGVYLQEPPSPSLTLRIWKAPDSAEDPPKTMICRSPSNNILPAERREITFTGWATDDVGIRSVKAMIGSATYDLVRTINQINENFAERAVHFSRSLQLPPFDYAAKEDKQITDVLIRVEDATGKYVERVFSIARGRMEDPTPAPDLCIAYNSPVSARQGNYIRQEEDFDVPCAATRLALWRRYNSVEKYDGPLGEGWNHYFDWRLFEVTDLDTDYVIIRKPCGVRLKFTKLPDGQYQTPRSYNLDLQALGNGGFRMREKSGDAYFFDAAGRLIRYENPHGLAVLWHYDQDTRRLAQVTGEPSACLTFSYGSDRKLIEVEDQTGRKVEYTYSSGLQLATVKDPCGFLMRYAYRPDRNLRRIADDGDREVISMDYDNSDRISSYTIGQMTYSYSYDTQTLQTTVTDSAGNTKVTSTNVQGQLVLATDFEGNSIQANYDDDSGLVLGSMSTNGAWVRYTYDEYGNILTKQNPDGSKRFFEYAIINGRHVRTSKTDELGNKTLYAHDAFGNCTSICDALGNVSTMEYDTNGKMTRLVDSRGGTHRYIYNEDGTLARTVDPLGHVSSRSYDDLGRLVSQTTPGGYRYDFEYDPMGRQTAEILPEDASGVRSKITYAYNQLGQFTQAVNPSGTIIRHAYDQFGNLTVATDPAGLAIVRTYDHHRNPLTEMDKRGYTKRCAYDRNGFEVENTDPLGNVRRIVRDAAGRVSSVVERDGATTSFIRNDRGFPIKRISPDGSETAFSYDALGRLTRVVPPNGSPQETEYDAVGNIICDRTYLDTTAVEYWYTYDEAGNRTSVQAPDGAITRLKYDLLNRCTEIIDALGNSTRYEYDPTGNVTKLTNALGHSWHYEYDFRGKRTKETDPLGLSKSFAYDKEGRLTSWTDKGGQTTHLSYNLMGRMIRTEHPNGECWEFDHDAEGNIIETRGLGPDGESVTVSSVFDACNRLISQACSATNRILRYAYTPTGLRAELQVVNAQSGNTECHLTYDWFQGALQGIFPSTGDRPSVTFEYLPGKLLRSYKLSNGVECRYSYDSLNRITNVSYVSGEGDPLYNCVYTFDLLGNRVARADTAGTEQYSYDRLSRLTQVEYSDSSVETYSYDCIGNRLSKQNGAATTQYSYDAAGRMQQAGAAILQWTPNGEVAAVQGVEGITQYEWGLNGKLLTVQSPGGLISRMKYLPSSDLRYEVQSDQETTRYVWDHQNRVQDVSEDGSARVTFLSGLGPDHHFAETTGTETVSYLSDLLNTVKATLDSSDTLQHYGYSPFGEALDSSAPKPRYGFQGRTQDTTGLYYYRARYYSPELGMFLSPDPAAGQHQGEEYQLANQNPVNWNDPLGLLKWHTLRENRTHTGGFGVETEEGSLIVNGWLKSDADAQVMAFENAKIPNGDWRRCRFYCHGYVYGRLPIPYVDVRSSNASLILRYYWFNPDTRNGMPTLLDKRAGEALELTYQERREAGIAERVGADKDWYPFRINCPKLPRSKWYTVAFRQVGSIDDVGHSAVFMGGTSFRDKDGYHGPLILDASWDDLVSRRPLSTYDTRFYKPVGLSKPLWVEDYQD